MRVTTATLIVSSTGLEICVAANRLLLHSGPVVGGDENQAGTISRDGRVERRTNLDD